MFSFVSYGLGRRMELRGFNGLVMFNVETFTSFLPLFFCFELHAVNLDRIVLVHCMVSDWSCRISAEVASSVEALCP